MVTHRKGFTLIELLVVIAIIGILAAMLFPVFARARESARKTQCLANVKNIAMAVQIYLTDYDRLLPSESSQRVYDYFGSSGDCKYVSCAITQANPYLNAPVILDEYVKSREIWRCPSAPFTLLNGINWAYGTGDWFGYATEGDNIHLMSPVTGWSEAHIYPTGWGGSITDSVTQGWPTGDARTWSQGVWSTGSDKAFGSNYCYITEARDVSENRMGDPSKFVVFRESGMNTKYNRSSLVAYPDFCYIDENACLNGPDGGACGSSGWSECPWSKDCGADSTDHGAAALDPTYRKEHFRARHLNGDNVAFADGHAKWFMAEALLFGGANTTVGGNSGHGFGNDSIMNNVPVCITPNSTGEAGPG